MSTAIDELDRLAPPAEPDPPAEEPPADGWQTDRRGRSYIRAQGRNGIIYRVGEETPEQARERDAIPKDQRPRRRSKTAKMPPAPSKPDLKEIETLLVDAFSSPAFVCAGMGDQWAADHFTRQAPLLARNLVLAAQHNPWLMRKLENAASGGDMMMKVISMASVAGAAVAYALPPIIYWTNMAVPDKAREMFGIPDRRETDDGPEPAPAFADAA